VLVGLDDKLKICGSVKFINALKEKFIPYSTKSVSPT